MVMATVRKGKPELRKKGEDIHIAYRTIPVHRVVNNNF